MTISNMNNWNRAYADCSGLVADIAALTRFRDITPSGAAVANATATHRHLANNWIVALTAILTMVDVVKSGAAGASTCGFEGNIAMCRDVLLEVRSQLQDLLGTDEFESLRHCMLFETERACA